jgi:hypothetical protein
MIFDRHSALTDLIYRSAHAFRLGTLRWQSQCIGASCPDDRTEGNGLLRVTILEQIAIRLEGHGLHPWSRFRAISEEFFLGAQLERRALFCSSLVTHPRNDPEKLPVAWRRPII